jgi:N-methylhydantoinase A
MSHRIGIDTGGTFTDLVAFDTQSGKLSFYKLSSTPDDPARAIVEGLQQFCADQQVAPAAIELLVHGTTVATNAVLERRGAKVALITTAGFRDVLHIQRQDRPRMYDLRSRRSPPLVPRRLRLELDERMRFDGKVTRPVNHDQLQRLVELMAVERVEAVAVGFLHSYVNPAHELEVGAALAEALPEVTVCLSHEIVGEQGEYERFSTCVMNAFVQPTVARYLERLEQRLSGSGVNAPLLIMKSNGGVMTASVAAHHCVETVLSGPAGGVVTGAAIAAGNDNSSLITADMGGTSFDVAVIHGQKSLLARTSEIGGLALNVPMLDIHTIGAGGGSIAWIDSGGALRVGPASAGAAPGPACYGRGGTEPTVSDANLVLGRLSSKSLLAGSMSLDPEAAQRAIHNRIAAPLRLSLETAAEGIVRVVNAAMTAAIRRLTVERGHDPRQFALCPFGGAGPLHGAELAAELGVRQTIIPIAPGVASAMGLLMSNLREDRVKSYIRLLTKDCLPQLEQMFSELTQHANQRLASVSGGDRAVRRALGLRYHGQRYDLVVPLPDSHLDCRQIESDFHGAHQQAYGYRREDEPVEICRLEVSVEVELQPVMLPLSKPATAAPPTDARRAVFAGRAYDTPVFRRDTLGAGTMLRGPAIIEQLDATTVVWPGQELRVDQYGQLQLGPWSL